MGKQLRISLSSELIVDLFAGGGGASLGIEMATGRMVDIAVNHDPEAVAMHMANHPTTRHLISDVFEADPREITEGRPVGLLWASPDCKHHSKAKGGKPKDKRIRSLAWVVIRWAKTVKPRVICLENVEEFRDWCPLDGDGYPVKEKRGVTFRIWKQRLEHLGYRVEYRALKACDYGTPTIRKRLFLIARCDGLPIVWPEPTHGPGRRHPYRTAAECIDWSLPCPSIFERKKPLAEATCRRIAKGIMRYVVNAEEPFIVPLTHHGDDRVYPISEPLRTVTGANRGELALVAPFVSTYYGDKRPGDVRGCGLDDQIGTQTTENRHALVCASIMVNTSGHAGGQPEEPLHTVTTGGHHALVAAMLTEHANASSPRCNSVDEPLRTICAEVKGGHYALVSTFLAKHYGGNCTNPASALADPVSTITAIDHHSLCASNLVKLRNNCTGQDHRAPLHTITGGAEHFAEVRAFLVKYYGVGQEIGLEDPLHTATSRDRFGLVTVHGEEYAIADIGLRMLSPRELFRAQGFPDDYIIDRGADGRPLTKTAQVRMCGNSVCPPIAAAIVRANYRDIELERVA
jgi:DNA (cytosine-5)-methyltransferase 1